MASSDGFPWKGEILPTKSQKRAQIAPTRYLLEAHGQDTDYELFSGL
ncbi:hypothetical protein GGR37_000160 [Novosphingobium taihuense]|uniref:Uncharacterized protein n=1 Tax=Novosphingobium taihuense TaxID=260085 RepID=A0A7W7ESF6_9SPHN|nr:hypothetical protein [Novosphingobium taihuense]